MSTPAPAWFRSSLSRQRKKRYLSAWKLWAIALGAIVLIVIVSSQFREYLGAVEVHYVATMSGAVSLAIAFYNNIKGKLDERLFYIIAIFFFFFAGYQAWHDQKTDKAIVQGRLDDLTIPKFDLYMDGTMVGPATDGTIIICVVRIENHGAPSGAKDFSAELELSSGETVQASGFQPPGPLVVYQDGGRPPFSLQQSDYVPVKALQPIPMNGGIGGWFAAEARGVMINQTKSALVRITLRDYTGKEYHAEARLTGNTNVLNLPTPVDVTPLHR
jgi:hypothetical protein